MTEHYFSPQPSVPSRPSAITLQLPGLRLDLTTDRGVFAAGQVDAGTTALLRKASFPPESGDLLDLGCGYGPIACTLAVKAPAATVWAVDVNERALELTAQNAEDLGLANIRAVPPEQVPIDVRFAGIWSNPPIKAGKAVLHEMLLRWLGRLQPSAFAWLVVSKHLGGDSLASWLTGNGWEVRRLASKSGYRVLQVGHPTAQGAHS